MTDMLNEIFALDKRLAIANQRVQTQFPEYGSIQQFIDGYLHAYAHFHTLSVPHIIEHNNNFARIYARHLETFQESGQYPCEYKDNTIANKTAYDIALILSCITNTARYEIIETLIQNIKKLDRKKICVIGAGAGIELSLIRKYASDAKVVAYDLAIDGFIKQQFPAFTLKQENFLSAEMTEQFDTIFAIELLEHVEDHEKILQKSWQYLKNGGHLICTTATNMPQFDHVYNFKDIELFKTEVANTGFTVIEHREFCQRHGFHAIEAKNDWFVLKK